MDEIDWGLQQIWNRSLDEKEERPVNPRDHLWASELGRAPLELFFKLRGVVPTNPPNYRAKRKFEAGITFEWIVNLILKRAGILIETQTYLKHQYRGLLQVTGKADFLAGGEPTPSAWKEDFEKIEMPEFYWRAAENITEYLQERYYNKQLNKKFLEIKSVSRRMFDMIEAAQKSQKSHRLQIFHYLLSCKDPEMKGLICYICRDDLSMIEFPVTLDKQTEKEYKEAVKRISDVYKANKDVPLQDILIPPDSSDELKWIYNPNGLEGLPPLEEPIIFDEDLGKFSRNWNVEYSDYLTMLYGYPSPMDVEAVTKPKVARWNRVMNRVATNQKMTPKNMEVIKEMADAGYDALALAAKYKTAPLSEEEE